MSSSAVFVHSCLFTNIRVSHCSVVSATHGGRGSTSGTGAITVQTGYNSAALAEQHTISRSSALSSRVRQGKVQVEKVDGCVAVVEWEAPVCAVGVFLSMAKRLIRDIISKGRPMCGNSVLCCF